MSGERNTDVYEDEREREEGSVQAVERRWAKEREGRGEKRIEAPPGEPRSHPRSKLSDNL